MVRKYQAKVIKHTRLIDNIYELEFSSLGRKFKYLSGQFLHLAIDHYDGVGQWPDSRCFSMQTSPSDSTLKITYAAKGVFTSRMSEELKPESTVWLKMPYGNLFENDFDDSKTIFIAGGTGITPFLSLFTDNHFTDFKKPHLFLGVRKTAYNLYQNQLDKAKKLNKELEITLHIEDTNGRPAISDILAVNGLDSFFFISGPPAMIAYYKQELVSKGVSTSNILTDDWE